MSSLFILTEPTVQVSERLYPRVVDCEIRHACYGASDHVPVVLDLSGSLE